MCTHEALDAAEGIGRASTGRAELDPSQGSILAVLTNVTEDNPAFRQELFGPVATVYRVEGEGEALALANDTPFGLGSYVFTTDPEQAARVADGIQAGMVFVNGVLAEGAELPFGGVKRSGFGREMGPLGIEEFLNKKLIRTIA